MKNYRVVQIHIDELCQELRPILDAELAAGNIVFETWKGNWPLDNCLYVMLDLPFRLNHEPLPEYLRLIHVNNPHYWKDEIICDLTHHVLACKYKS